MDKEKKGYFIGALFFLNPISIIITGYHNQFDNIAVFFALSATSFFDDESEKLSKKDFYAILFLTLSLLTKHILFIFFLWLLLKKTNVRLSKRLSYFFIPLIMFGVSFVPYIINNQVALKGIIENVFLYRSHNNYPLLRSLLNLLQVPTHLYIIIYLIIMVVMGFLYKNKNFDELLLCYFVCMVAFSSAIANQYLIIPIVALVIYERKVFLLYIKLLERFIVY